MENLSNNAIALNRQEAAYALYTLATAMTELVDGESHKETLEQINNFADNLARQIQINDSNYAVLLPEDQTMLRKGIEIANNNYRFAQGYFAAYADLLGDIDPERIYQFIETTDPEYASGLRLILECGLAAPLIDAALKLHETI